MKISLARIHDNENELETRRVLRECKKNLLEEKEEIVLENGRDKISQGVASVDQLIYAPNKILCDILLRCAKDINANCTIGQVMRCALI